MQKQLFRQYDIRGKIGSELAIHDFYDIAHAIITFFRYQGCSSLVVGMDGRVHSLQIFHQIAAACKDAGVDVYFLGVCSTPVTVFAHYDLPVEGSIMITASHNPAEYNGLKIYYNKVAIEGEKLQQIYELFSQKVRSFRDKNGRFFDAHEYVEKYVDSLVAEFEHLKNFDQPVFIDCGNGSGGPIVRLLTTKMAWKHATILFEVVDGTYPHHEADPTNSKNMIHVLAAVQEHQGAFGIGLDGDCDRVGVISAYKGLLAADQLLALFAQSMNASVIVADVKSSSVVSHFGAHAILAKTGCANIKTVMLEHNVLLGGELSGHFFFKDRHLGYDDGIYGMLRFFEILVQQGVTCDDLVARLPESFATSDIRIPCSDQIKFSIVDEIKVQLLQDCRFAVSCIDGVRFSGKDGWGLIRGSNTQPVLSVCCEATSLDGLQNIKTLLITLLQPYFSVQILEQYIV
jgi:phosphomannomutase